LGGETAQRIGARRPDDAEGCPAPAPAAPRSPVAFVEETLEVAPAQSDPVAAWLVDRRQVAPGRPRAHGVAMHAGEAGSLGQRDELCGRSRPGSEGHRAWRSSLFGTGPRVP